MLNTFCSLLFKCVHTTLSLHLLLSSSIKGAAPVKIFKHKLFLTHLPNKVYNTGQPVGHAIPTCNSTQWRIASWTYNSNLQFHSMADSQLDIQFQLAIPLNGGQPAGHTSNSTQWRIASWTYNSNLQFHSTADSQLDIQFQLAIPLNGGQPVGHTIPTCNSTQRRIAS